MSSVTEDVARRARKFQANYEAHEKMLLEFFQTFEEPGYSDDFGGSATWGKRKYRSMLQNVANKHNRILNVELDDIRNHMKSRKVFPDEKNPTLEIEFTGEDVASAVEQNTSRYKHIIENSLDKLRPERNHYFNVGAENSPEEAVEEWRRARNASILEGPLDPLADPKMNIPTKLMRNFETHLIPSKQNEVLKLREVKSESTGQLLSINAIVTKCGPVLPRIEVATYQCSSCRTEIYQVCESLQFTPALECPTQICKTNKVSGQLQMHYRTSKFVKYQEIRVQELSSEVPVGDVPHAMTVVLQGDLCNSCLPGDGVKIHGIYLPFPKVGFQAFRQGLTMEMFLEAQMIQKHKQGYSDEPKFGENEITVKSLLEDRRVQRDAMYQNLAKSIAPEIHGHEDIKKALLLQLVGGVQTCQKDGMKLRGDLHILLMGDPGVAKSQLMKQISNLAPRGIYTTGKGSSSAGLTASIIRDNVTKEVSLEGGALVMADNGICCIDEFDKMEESDRTAIHEVMEQQTVSIAKAGITTTLNARASVLAAANPVYGRYNPEKTPLQNINLPPALLSRFDVIFLLLDRVDYENDYKLATAICEVHRTGAPTQSHDILYDSEFIRNYVRVARRFTPILDDPTLESDIVSQYAEMRARERQDSIDERRTYTTPRQLLSILRLSQAHARIRFSDSVERQDYDEAMRLMNLSRDSMQLERQQPDPRTRDYKSSIFALVSIRLQDPRNLDEEGYGRMVDVEREILAKGYSRQQLEETLTSYESLNIFIRTSDRTRIYLV